MNRLLGGLVLGGVVTFIVYFIQYLLDCPRRAFNCSPDLLSPEWGLAIFVASFALGVWKGLSGILKDANRTRAKCPYCKKDIPHIISPERVVSVIDKTFICDGCNKKITKYGEKAK